jgi:hypothetical protein
MMFGRKKLVMDILVFITSFFALIGQKMGKQEQYAANKVKFHGYHRYYQAER